MGKLRSVIMGIVFALQVVYLPVAPVYIPRGSAGVTMINMAFELVFLVDFLLHFNMAYYEPKSLALVKFRKKIAWAYIKSWFIVDLLSSVPVDSIVFFGLPVDDNSTQKETDAAYVLFHTLFRIPRLYHVLSLLNHFFLLSRKLSAGRDFISWLFYSRYSHLMRIIRLILLVVLTAHYMACGWQLVTKSDPDAPNAVRPGASVFEKYVLDVYYSVLLIQGRGDARGTSVQQNIFSIIAVLLGSVVLAIVFGNVGMLVANFHANAINYQRKMEVVFATMNKMKLLVELRQRIYQYYAHLWQEYESLDGDIVKFSKELAHSGARSGIVQVHEPHHARSDLAGLFAGFRHPGRAQPGHPRVPARRLHHPPGGDGRRDVYGEPWDLRAHGRQRGLRQTDLVLTFADGLAAPVQAWQRQWDEQPKDKWQCDEWQRFWRPHGHAVPGLAALETFQPAADRQEGPEPVALPGLVGPDCVLVHIGRGSRLVGRLER